MKKYFVTALIFGIPSGILMSYRFWTTMGLEGAILGALSGLVGGMLCSTAFYLLSQSKPIRTDTKLVDEDLFSDEYIIISEDANLIIKPREFGLRNLAFDDFLWAVGMKDKEALGGMLHLTNFRLIFKSHRFNRLRGKTSIFLPVVKEIKNTSSFIVKKVTVETNTGKIDFVLDDIDKLIKEVNTQNRKLHDKSLIKLKQLSVQFPEKCSDGLLTWTSMNSVNNLLLIAKAGKKAAGVVSNPLGALSAILLKEFYDLTISDFVKNKMKQGV